MARACVDCVGCRRPVVVGYFGHDIQDSLIDVLSRVVLEILAVPNIKERKENEENKPL